MKRWLTLFGILVTVLLLAVAALGAERGGVRMPDQISVADKALHLNGMGIREATILNIDVYVAGLYLERASSDAARIVASDGETKRLVMRFVRDVDRSDIVEAYREGFEKNSGEAATRKLKPRIDKLLSWMTDIKDGETMVLSFLPGKGVEIAVKGHVKGTIAGDDFARAVMSLWLGPHPPNAGLKEGLLGKR